MPLPTHRPPSHPGEILLEEVLKPAGITQDAFAAQLGVTRQRLHDLLHGKRAVTTDTALRLAQVLDTTPDLWLGLQQAWDLWHAMRTPEAKAIEKLKRLKRKAAV